MATGGCSLEVKGRKRETDQSPLSKNKLCLKYEIFGFIAITIPIISASQANVLLIEVFNGVWLISD
jgi:hypothetical protein